MYQHEGAKRILETESKIENRKDHQWEKGSGGNSYRSQDMFSQRLGLEAPQHDSDKSEQLAAEQSIISLDVIDHCAFHVRVPWSCTCSTVVACQLGLLGGE